MAASSRGSVPTWGQAIRPALPDFLIALAFLFVWVCPNLLQNTCSWPRGPGLVGFFVFLMFFEFVFVAAFGPVAGLAYSRQPLPGKLIGMSIVGLFFAPFLVVLSRAAASAWPVVQVVLLGYNKWLCGKQTDNYTAGLYYIIFRWAAMATLYLAVLFLVAFIPIPKFGVEASMMHASGLRMSGVIARQPQMLLAAGVIYFSCLGIYELFFDRVIRKHFY